MTSADNHRLVRRQPAPPADRCDRPLPDPLAERHVPAFGTLYYDPAKETSQAPIHEQLETLAKLVKAGKVRTIGLSERNPLWRA